MPSVRKISSTLLGTTLKRRGARRRSVAAALLCLIAHGFFVSITHHHPASLREASGFSIESSKEESSKNHPQSSDDSNCISCQVSRTFHSLDRSQYLVIQFPVQALVREKLLAHFLPSTPSLVISGRSPPIA